MPANKQWRLVIGFVALIVLAAAVAACGSSSSSSSSSTPASSETPAEGETEGEGEGESGEKAEGAGGAPSTETSGNVNWWTDQPAEGVEKFISAFNEEYPNITVTPTIGADAGFVSRFEVENKSHKVGEDVVTIGYDGFAKEWNEKGYLQNYCAPEGKSLDKKYVGEGCAYYVNTVLPTGVCYNSAALESEGVEPPETFQDLVKPEYKGKIIMQNVLESGGGGWALMINTRGFWTKDGTDKAEEATWEKYWEELGEQEVIQAPSYEQGIQQVTQGNSSIMLPCYPSDVQELSAKGAPLVWIAPPPVIQVYYSQSIPKEAPDPEAAKAFMNWSLGTKGQESLSNDIGQVPVRSGIPYPEIAKPAQGVASYPALDTPWSQEQSSCCAAEYVDQAKKWFGVG